MPPKGSQIKADPAKAAKPKDAPAKVTPKKEAAPKPPTPRAPKPKPEWTELAADEADVIPITVKFGGVSEQAKLVKDGKYGAAIILQAPDSFSLERSVMIHEGKYLGYQAILIRPAKPFKFLNLPKEIRARIYGYYFAPLGVTNKVILVEGKRTSNKDLYAKSYCEGSKNRVGLLAVNKEIYDEAVPILYAHGLKLDSTSTLVDFLGQIQDSTKERFTDITINTFVKTMARNAMSFLANSPNLTRVHIESGVFGEADPTKAAKSFYGDAFKLLEAIGAKKKDKSAGVDALSFGTMALTKKDKQDEKKKLPWDDELIEEFKENLKAKLK